jgi:uncharacterized delta-60 repeat protein
MKIFNYKIINYRRFSVFFIVFSLIVSSMSLFLQKQNFAYAAPSDGTVDATFSVGTGFATSTFVQSFDIQTDGKIVAVGSFTTYNGTPAGRIIRLNTDGTIDPTFVSGTGFIAGVRNVKILTHGVNAGKILAVGDFESYNGTAVSNIALLNADGSLDTTFTTNSGTGFTGGSQAGQFIFEESDGTLLIAGYFTSYKGVSASHIVRLNADGTIDPTFVYGSGFNNSPNWVVKTSGGQYVIGGWFTTYNGTSANRIARLNADGTIDPTFNTNIGTSFNDGPWGINQQSDGKLIITGWFTTFNGTSANHIIRLNTDGTIDPTFVYALVDPSSRKLTNWKKSASRSWI